MNELSNNLFNDDKLINLIKEKFDENDNELFQLSFKLYTSTQNNPEDYLINLDDIYKWIGFSRKSDAKKLLINSFNENKDYKILLRRSPQQDYNQHGGNNKEQIMLTIICFKKFCMKSSTKQADKIYDYYIKMEEIIFKYIQDQYKEQQNIIQQNIKVIENNNKILELKDKELEDKTTELNNLKNQKYEEHLKIGSIYVFSTDKKDIYKCGRTKNIQKRKS